MFLLLVELLAVTLFLWGNDAYSISATTPEFKWENYKTIAHALGGIGDKTYLNSKESFLAGYQMGCRLFEVDLVKTSDNVWVCRHSWYQSLGQWEGDEKKVLSSEEFLSRPIYGKYTPITFEDLLVLLSDYPDAFVMLDSKQYSLRNYQKTVEDYADYIELAEDVQEIFDKKGIRLYIYTVNDLKEAQYYMQEGAAGVCSDYLQDTMFN